jgi:hypothetical protein
VLNTTAFTVANFRANKIGSNFMSPFTSNSAGWVAVSGMWARLATGYLTTAGVANRWSSVRHTGIYGDATYEARLKRTGCVKCANGLWLRGNPARLTVYRDWKPSYQFLYSNAGEFSVWRVSSTGTFTSLKQWTPSSAVIKKGWNTLKIVAVGSSLKFYINGTLVWAGVSASYPTGQVGLAMIRGASSTGERLYVDWARLSTTATADVSFDAMMVAPGVEVPGGDNRRSP